MDPLVKNSDFWVIYTSQNVFYFSSKKLDLVTITRYQITFWIFDFSLFDILPKYMNPKIVSRSLYALHDLPKNPDGRVRTRTDGHRFLNVCHTKALRAIKFKLIKTTFQTQLVNKIHCCTKTLYMYRLVGFSKFLKISENIIIYYNYGVRYIIIIMVVDACSYNDDHRAR